MLYNVQVRLESGELAVRMSEMREWLDRRGFEPEVFEYRRMDVDGANRSGPIEPHVPDVLGNGYPRRVREPSPTRGEAGDQL